MGYFVRAGSLLGFPELVLRHQQNPTTLMQSVGFGPSILNDPDLYIPYSALSALLERAAIQCKAPDFGVQLGMRQGLEALGALAPALCLQRTVADALALIRKNLDFHGRGVFLDTHMEAPWIDLTMRFAFERQWPCDQLTALSMTLLARGIEQLHGRADRPVLATLNIQTPPQPSAYSNAWGCTVQFEQIGNMLRYPLDGLLLPIQIDDALRTQLAKRWRYAQQDTLELDMADQVQRAITALLPTGECNLNMVARVLSIHPRSMQMRLQQSQQSFGSILQRTRLKLACQHLAQGEMDLTTLAMNLGYAEQSVFSRAFKQWTGLNPSDWKARSTP